MIWEATVFISLIIIPIIMLTTVIPQGLWGWLCLTYCKRLHTGEMAEPWNN